MRCKKNRRTSLPDPPPRYNVKRIKQGPEQCKCYATCVKGERRITSCTYTKKLQKDIQETNKNSD